MKNVNNVNMEDVLTREWLCALCSLLHVTDGYGVPDPETNTLLLQALAAPEEQFPSCTARLREKKAILTQNCQGCANPCGRTEDYTFAQFSAAPEPVRNARLALLAQLRLSVRNALQNYPDIPENLAMPEHEIQRFCQALYQVGWGSDESTLLDLTHNLSCHIK